MLLDEFGDHVLWQQKLGRIDALHVQDTGHLSDAMRTSCKRLGVDAPPGVATNIHGIPIAANDELARHELVLVKASRIMETWGYGYMTGTFWNKEEGPIFGRRGDMVWLDEAPKLDLEWYRLHLRRIEDLAR
ncbi:hypothetical protein [uncultured Maritimibacter sp.]|uniref:hypothetical protein n=1 Tax=uncultured Maritimibacter sp. TaxID=991866 RepID=UPI00259992B3|nr:hypothetical protein [uncultured Maritimibacter sp.]